MSRISWHILTGEYPPECGGVSDYTGQVAVQLTKTEADVHVWTHGVSKSVELIEGVFVHRSLGEFETNNLFELEKQLTDPSTRSILLVQYVPHGFGMKAMNLPFAYWIDRQASMLGVDVRLMLHEIAFPFVRWPLHHNLIAIANRWMLRTILKNPRKIYLSTVAWKPIVEKFSQQTIPMVCLPIPSNIPHKSQSNSRIFREQVSDGERDAIVVGHFGTFGGDIRILALETMSRLLNGSELVRLVLVGRGAVKAKEELLNKISNDLAPRVFAVSDGQENEVAAWIQACDIMLQPYPDGISTRRTSAMAGLSNAIAVVSNLGSLSESFWQLSSAVALAERPDVDLLTGTTLELIHNSAIRKRCAEAGFAMYEENFSIGHTMSVLLKDIED